MSSDSVLVRKLGRAKFRVLHRHRPDDALFLDFNPLIKIFGLTGSFELHHFQARPKGDRCFGVYRSDIDTYEAYDRRELPSGEMIAIDERKFNTIPSAVFLCRL